MATSYDGKATRTFTYDGGSERRGLATQVDDTGAVYTSTEAPSAVKIPLHNELSFVRHFPKHIYFYCDVAPSEKGETILGDARRVYRSLDTDVRRWVEDGLKAGRLKAVVATSSLDLGVDFSPVDQVLQIGSPKGVARLLQRATDEQQKVI